MTIVEDLELLRDFVEALRPSASSTVCYRHRETLGEGDEGLSDLTFELDLLTQQPFEVRRRMFVCEVLLSLYLDPDGGARFRQQARMLEHANIIYEALRTWRDINIESIDIAYELAIEDGEQHRAAISIRMHSRGETT